MKEILWTLLGMIVTFTVSFLIKDTNVMLSNILFIPGISGFFVLGYFCMRSK